MSSQDAPGDTSADIFSPLLDLEDQYHSEGYNLGLADGAKAGRVEGRVFGLEKGFEKFVELGRLRGRALLWQAQVQESGNERLKKHIDRLAALTDPNEFAIDNSEEAVEDIEERLRDARGKERIVKRTLTDQKGPAGSTRETADKSISPQTLRVKRSGPGPSAGAASRSGEMEDFAGLPGSRVSR